MNTCHGFRIGGMVWLAGIGLVLLSLTGAGAQDKGKTKPVDKQDPPIVKVVYGPEGKKVPPITSVIPLDAPDALQITDSLKAMFGSFKTAGLYIEYFPHRKALLLRGTGEQIQEVKNVLKALGDPEPKTGNVRVFNLEKGSAATMAEALQRMMKTMHRNPVKIIVPSTTPSKKEPAKKHEEGLFDPKSTMGEGVTLIAMGNKLVVTTDDPKTMNLIADVIRLFQEPMPIGDFEVIPLKFARAISVANVLDEAFNGPKGKGGFSAPRHERIRVVADPAANLLLVSAQPLDALTIRNLVERSLDVANGEKGDQQLPKSKKGSGKEGK